jgi:2-polyprenyl-3-methyl-5-hydroxy-6-metoxy-1,4-benzoquinol methylase
MTETSGPRKQQTCRLCDGQLSGARLSEPIESRRGRRVLLADNYTLAVCKRCGLAQVDFYVEQAYLNEGYESEDAALILEIAGRAPSELSAARMPEFQRVLDLVVRFADEPPNGKVELLDVGCQDGRLLSMARGLGLRVAGLEPSADYARMASENLPGADIVHGSLDTVTIERQADVVTFLETLEHIAEPRGALAAVRSLVKPGGLIVISVPSWTYFKFKWRVFRVIRRPMSQIHSHITCFSRVSLHEVAAVLGGEVKHLEPTGWHGRFRFTNGIVRLASRLRLPFLCDFGPSLTLVVRTGVPR